MPDPDVVWEGDRIRSRRFHDIYFSEDGPRETHRVFLEPASLIERIRTQPTFTIVEFGFGSGLNFLTLARVLSEQTITTRLRYIGVDKYPLRSPDVARALTRFESDIGLIDELLAQLPPRVPGWHRRYFHDVRLELTLCYDDIANALNEFIASDQSGVDAWFLDGFAPDRNPEMWQHDLFRTMHTVTKTGGSVTTFSAAGRVRSGLQEAGFNVQRVEGQNTQKRHTTLATLDGNGYTPVRSPNHVRVVGGGLAGLTVAHTFARKGVRVEVCERAESVGSATSAIPAAIQHPRLSAADTILALFRIHAYAHAQAFLTDFQAVSAIGAFHLPDDGMPSERLSRVAQLLGDDWMTLLDTQATADRTNQETLSAWFPRSAIVHGAQLCQELLRHDLIQVSTNREYEFLACDDIPTIYATGGDMPDQIVGLPIEAIAIPGQVDAFSIKNSSKPLHHIIAHNGYVAPQNKLLFAGSTYEYKPWPDGEARRVNKARIESLLADVSLQHEHSFRASRVVTSDRLPIVGEIANQCWVSGAHGSGGTISAPFAAELIASTILKEVPAGSSGIPRLLAPDRFRHRQERRPNPLTRGFGTGPSSA